MSGWASSDRSSRLPKDWHKRRARAKREAGGQCQWLEVARCREPGTECDHIIRPEVFVKLYPGEDPDQAANLQWLCSRHHKMKTVAERRTRPSQRADVERHPGLL